MVGGWEEISVGFLSGDKNALTLTVGRVHVSVTTPKATESYTARCESYLNKAVVI